MPNHHITLVIATFNGARTLPKTLASINNLAIPAVCQFNVIIIDNNSNDSTAKLLNEYQCAHSLLKLHQTKQGKNSALNLIFENDIPLGQLLIFSDDDVILPTDFIHVYHELALSQPDVDIFGGAVIPKWPGKIPLGLLEGVDVVVAFAITPAEAGYHTGLIEPVKLHGPNMAIRRHVFSQNIKFNENIGPNGANYMMGSESELLYRLREAGFRAYYQHELKVEHIIRPEQLTPTWIANRAYKAGRSLVMHQLKNQQAINVATIMGYPRWAVLQYLVKKLRRLVTSNNSAQGYSLLWKANHLKGYCAEYKSYMTSISKAAN